jgi:phage gp45-like
MSKNGNKRQNVSSLASEVLRDLNHLQQFKNS